MERLEVRLQGVKKLGCKKLNLGEAQRYKGLIPLANNS